MKRTLMLLLVLALAVPVAFTSCASGKKGGKGGLGGQVEGESFVTEGWVNDDTYRTTAVGSPGAKFKDKSKYVQRNAAKEAARLLAVNNVLKKFKGERIEAASGMANFETTGIAVSSEVEGFVRGGSIIKETYSEENDCEIVYEVQATGLKKMVRGVDIK